MITAVVVSVIVYYLQAIGLLQNHSQKSEATGCGFERKSVAPSVAFDLLASQNGAGA